ncbi:MAG TPA: hypothetical protein VLE48_11155 [Terriglobales bacterium]|nr:hypothetical protein [Terriglobales bacterium]
MTTTATSIAVTAAQWREARRIYPIYDALTRYFELGLAPLPEMESAPERVSARTMSHVLGWLDEMDERVKVYQLRQFLQTSPLATEESLRALILRHLNKVERSDADRDKLDFLLVQYFVHTAPAEFHDRDVSEEEVLVVLAPVLGEVAAEPSECSPVLEDLLERMRQCAGLSELFAAGVLDEGRRWKTALGEAYYEPLTLVAFTRFNYLMRGAFFRLMQAELHAIRVAADTLAARGVESVDCSVCGLAATQSLADLRRLAQEWKKPFQASYAAGRPFEQLMAIRECLEKALQPAAPVPAEPVACESEAEVLEVEEARAEADKAQEPITEDPTAEAAAVAVEPVQPSPAVPEVEEPAGPADVDACIEAIAEQLLASPRRGSAATTIVLNGSKVLLSTWEVASFVQGGDEISDALQRAVAARTWLFEAMDRAKRTGQPLYLNGRLTAAQAEATSLSEWTEKAKQTKNIDAAVNLAATAKRLQSVIDEATRLSDGGAQ